MACMMCDGVAVFTCDDCNLTAEVDLGAGVPDGWSKWTAATPSHLCPQCRVLASRQAVPNQQPVEDERP